MSKKSLKDPRGWIEAIYGDYWSAKKKLIMAGFLVPFVFSILFLFEANILLTIFNIPFDPWMHFNGIIEYVGLTVIIIIVFILSIVSLSLQLIGDRMLSKIFIDPLNSLYNEIYVKKSANQKGMLEKHLFVALLHSIKQFVYFLLFLFIGILLYIPSLFFGYLGYIQLTLYFIPKLSLLVKFFPLIGESIGNSIQLMFESIINISQASWLNTTTTIIIGSVIFVALLAIFGFMDLIESSTNVRYRGDSKTVLKNGIKTTIDSLNLPRKIAKLVYTTFLCLFTDQKGISLNIPVVNGKNVEIAMQNALSTTKPCYIAKLPLDPKRLIEIINDSPPEFQQEIKGAFKKISKHDKAFLTSFGKSFSSQNKKYVARLHIIYGLNEENVKSYAVVYKQPSNYSSRLIQTLWCSDPVIKDKIIHNLESLESSKA